MVLTHTGTRTVTHMKSLAAKCIHIYTHSRMHAHAALASSYIHSNTRMQTHSHTDTRQMALILIVTAIMI